VGIDGIENKGYAVIRKDETVIVNYPRDKTPDRGISFHHGAFISKLRLASKKHEKYSWFLIASITTLEATVMEILTEGTVKDALVQGVEYSIKSESGESNRVKVFAPLTIIADGCFSKFRRQVIAKKPIVKSNFVGLVLTDCILPNSNYGHVVLASPSPILLYQIGTRDTRILVDVPGKLPSSIDGSLKFYMKDFVCPQLPKSVQESFLVALESGQAIRSMPNSWLPPTQCKTPGLLMLGDAMNMRHPLTVYRLFIFRVVG
jgi:squalene monooxygenase